MKYKLIQTYPGSPELDAEVEVHGYKHYIHEGRFFTEGEIESNPDYWEEVIPKDYEILSFITIREDTSGEPSFLNSNGRHEWNTGTYNGFTTQEMLASKRYGIHSVKRLSDGEVFTIGDTIKSHNFDTIKIIESIVIDSDYVNGIRFNYKSGRMSFATAQHAKQPLFITEDGVDIFEGDRYWYINTQNNASAHVHTAVNTEKGEAKHTIYYSTEKLVEEALIKLRNMPKKGDLVYVRDTTTDGWNIRIYESGRATFVNANTRGATTTWGYISTTNPLTDKETLV